MLPRHVWFEVGHGWNWNFSVPFSLKAHMGLNFAIDFCLHMGLEITAKIFISLPEGQGCGSGSGFRISN